MSWGTIAGTPTNICTWNMLYPYNYATNYGGSYQFNVMPMNYTPQQAFNIQNVFNPFYQLMRLQSSISSAYNPYQNLESMMYASSGFNSGFQMVENMGNERLISSCGQNLASLKSQLEQALTSDKLSAAQKAELRALKREVEALEDKLANVALLRQSGATSEQIKVAVAQINNDYRVLRDKVQATAERIQAQLNGEEVANNEEVVDNEGAEETPGNNEETGRPSNLGAAPTKKELREWCGDFHQAINYFWGTDDELFEARLNEIDETNIIEINKHWNTKYAESDSNFILDMLSDAEHYQKREFSRIILNALETRAEALGIEDEIAEYVKAVNLELDDCNISKGITSKNLNAIIEKIEAAEAKKTQAE